MGYNSVFVNSHSLSASFNSAAEQVVDAELFSIQAVFSGTTCSFSAKIQISDDAASSTPTNWDDLANSSQTFTAAGTFTWNVSEVGYVWVRLVIADNSSGANNGQITATINVKGPM